MNSLFPANAVTHSHSEQPHSHTASKVLCHYTTSAPIYTRVIYARLRMRAPHHIKVAHTHTDTRERDWRWVRVRVFAWNHRNIQRQRLSMEYFRISRCAREHPRDMMGRGAHASTHASTHALVHSHAQNECSACECASARAPRAFRIVSLFGCVVLSHRKTRGFALCVCVMHNSFLPVITSSYAPRA